MFLILVDPFSRKLLVFAMVSALILSHPTYSQYPMLDSGGEEVQD